MIKINLAKLLFEKDMKQSDLSRKTGIRANTINDLCNEISNSVKFVHIDKICNVLECNIGDLFEYVADEEQKYKTKKRY